MKDSDVVLVGTPATEERTTSNYMNTIYVKLFLNFKILINIFQSQVLFSPKPSFRIWVWVEREVKDTNTNTKKNSSTKS